ncbi:hypothetical protein SBOR_3581 [Sclerotinia borealis F-4128]|uniref:Uncharacterized protein n=1 Tax=Sclerotinia borealis (strain F-4128) TaxID=1432307 RepID=W9CJ29_SCLBF|nr:hypothetical protein SBOR_3581 [Sclerotinia borealis F-4128]
MTLPTPSNDFKPSIETHANEWVPAEPLSLQYLSTLLLKQVFDIEDEGEDDQLTADLEISMPSQFHANTNGDQG